MIETMPVMAADAGIERQRHVACVGLSSEGLQQNFALPENGDSRFEDSAGVRVTILQRQKVELRRRTGLPTSIGVGGRGVPPGDVGSAFFGRINCMNHSMNRRGK